MFVYIFRYIKEHEVDREYGRNGTGQRYVQKFSQKT